MLACIILYADLRNHRVSGLLSERRTHVLFYTLLYV